MTRRADPADSAGDATMPVVRANLLALAWLPLSALLVLVPFILLHGASHVAASPPRLPSMPVGLALLAAAVLVHELLHAAGFLFVGRAPRPAVRIGFQRRTLTPFASCRAPVTASAYRSAALLPAAVMGGLPILAAWATGSTTLLLWGWLLLALAGGDCAAVWAMRSVPGTALVVDHERLVGCRVVREGLGSHTLDPRP